MVPVKVDRKRGPERGIIPDRAFEQFLLNLLRKLYPQFHDRSAEQTLQQTIVWHARHAPPSSRQPLRVFEIYPL